MFQSRAGRPDRRPVRARRARGRTSAPATTAPACASTDARPARRRAEPVPRVRAATARRSRSATSPTSTGTRPTARSSPTAACWRPTSRPAACCRERMLAEWRLGAGRRGAGHGRGGGRRVHRHGAGVHAGEARAAGQRVRALVPERLPDRHRDAGGARGVQAGARHRRRARRRLRDLRADQLRPREARGQHRRLELGEPAVGRVRPEDPEERVVAEDRRDPAVGAGDARLRGGEADQAARLRLPGARLLAEPGVADRRARTTRSGCTATSASAACRTG